MQAPNQPSFCETIHGHTNPPLQCGGGGVLKVKNRVPLAKAGYKPAMLVEAGDFFPSKTGYFPSS
jgi:hypothetical protein